MNDSLANASRAMQLEQGGVLQLLLDLLPDPGPVEVHPTLHALGAQLAAIDGAHVGREILEG